MKIKGNLIRICLLGVALLKPALMQAQFNFTTNNGAITITGYTGSDPVVVIPDTTNGYPVISIGENAFASCTNLTSIILPTNVTSIGVQSFQACVNLASVTIPDSVTNIGAGAFAYCSSLTNITIPSSVSFIDLAAFYLCFDLNEVYFQGNAPGIGSDPMSSGLDVFFGDYSATAIFLPGTTGWDTNFAELPTWSAYYTTNNGTIGIAKYAGFGGTVTVPAQIYGFPVTSIGTNAFASNISVTSITVPDTVTDLGDGAFYLCTNVTQFFFQGNAPAAAGSSVFQGVTNAIVYFLPGTIGWGSNFDGLTAWTLYPYDYSTTNGAITITGYTGGSGAVVIPGSITGLPVTGIQIDAFAYNASLTSVTIPGSVTNLGSVAFQWCTGLKSAYFQGNAVQAAYADAFASDTNVVIYYLPGTLGWAAMYEGHPTALWLPQAQTTGANFGGQTNPFGFNISWASGKTVVVEASTNFFDLDWQPVQTNVLVTGSTYFSDPQWTNYPGRFYRLRSP